MSFEIVQSFENGQPSNGEDTGIPEATLWMGIMEVNR